MNDEIKSLRAQLEELEKIEALLYNVCGICLIGAAVLLVLLLKI